MTRWHELRSLIRHRCLLSGDFTLSTGRKSDFYFDCKRATLDGEILTKVADLYVQHIRTMVSMPQAVGGLTMGADFIAAAVAMRAYYHGIPTINASIARKAAKEHGTQKLIENEQPFGTTILVVDDVITTGNATAQACRLFLHAGYCILGILALVDREQYDACRRLEDEFHCLAGGLFKGSDFMKL